MIVFELHWSEKRYGDNASCRKLRTEVEQACHSFQKIGFQIACVVAAGRVTKSSINGAGFFQKIVCYYKQDLNPRVSRYELQEFLVFFWKRNSKYMSHIENSLTDPFQDAPLLCLFLRGIKRSVGISSQHRLPITMALLRRIKTELARARTSSPKIS